MKNLSCKKSFAEGHKGREKHPLCNGGEYKLKENLRMLEKYLLELDRIADYKKTRNPSDRRTKGYALRHCTPDDMNIWLKDLPPHIAHTLSYSIIPATAALIKDGVPQDKVDALYKEAVERSLELVQRLSSGVLSSHRLKTIIAEAVGLIKHVLDEANLHIKLTQGGCPTMRSLADKNNHPSNQPLAK
jgi:hypothetical protein